MTNSHDRVREAEHNIDRKEFARYEPNPWDIDMDDDYEEVEHEREDVTERDVAFYRSPQWAARARRAEREMSEQARPFNAEVELAELRARVATYRTMLIEQHRRAERNENPEHRDSSDESRRLLFWLTRGRKRALGRALILMHQCGLGGDG